MRTAPATPGPDGAIIIQGRRVTLPAVVRDASAGTAMFVVPTGGVRALVPSAFEPVEVASGQTQVILGFVDYRDNDLGDYHEAMIAFFVRPAGTPGRPPRPDGTWIYKLPVDQSFTRDAGAGIWGFPKTIERIDVAYAPDCATATLAMDGRTVFTLSVPRSTTGGESPDLEMVTYTLLEGRPVAVPFTQGGSGFALGTEGVGLELGTHPIADELRALGLPCSAAMTTWTEHMRGAWRAPEPF
jgi:Acetoacetate decarboxylase (ADC)